MKFPGTEFFTLFHNRRPNRITGPGYHSNKRILPALAVINDPPGLCYRPDAIRGVKRIGRNTRDPSLAVIDHVIPVFEALLVNRIRDVLLHQDDTHLDQLVQSRRMILVRIRPNQVSQTFRSQFISASHPVDTPHTAAGPVGFSQRAQFPPLNVINDSTESTNGHHLIGVRANHIGITDWLA